MKTIKDLTIENINHIYSLIIGRESTAGNIGWTKEKDFVQAIFKVEECHIDDIYDTIEFGININSELRVDFIAKYISKRETVISYNPLYNQHEITKYLIDEGFSV